MAQVFTEAHLQRPTDTLRWPDTKKQVESLFDASYMIEKGQYSQGGKLLQDILKTQKQTNEKKYNSFSLQVNYNMVLTELYAARQYPVNMDKLMQKCITAFEQLLKEIQKQQEEYCDQEDQQQWEYADYLKIRIYTTLLQMSVKSDKGKLQDWMNSLCFFLRDHSSYLPEVLGKLCGCKHLREFCLNFNSDQIIEDETKSPSQKAKLIDMASSWLILGGQFQKGIKLKQKAVHLWKQANSLKDHEKCEIQYMELKSNSSSEFCIKLKKTARIITRILKGAQQPQQPNKNALKQTSVIVRKGLSKNLRKINEFNEQLDRIQDEINKANKKKSVWSSSKKSTSLSSKKSLFNDSKLSEYYQKSHQFQTQCYFKEFNEEITDLLKKNSKFILDQTRTMSKVIVRIVQLYTKRRKWAFLILKNCYIITCGILNPDFLKGLPLNNQLQNKDSSPQKNNKDLVRDNKSEQSQTFNGFNYYKSSSKN